jgi:hypothetical protein
MSGPTQQSWFQKKQVTVLLALLFAAALSLVDYLAGHEVYISAFYLTPIGWKWAGVIWGYALIWFLLNDRVKLAAYRILDPQRSVLSRAPNSNDHDTP